jgi:DNA-binding protein YbaB
MKEQSTLEARVREVLRAEAAAADTPVIETAAGLVRVKVDGRLRVQAVEFLETSMDDKARFELQQATVDALNVAMAKVVLAKAEALKRVQEQLDWKALVQGGQPRAS